MPSDFAFRLSTYLTLAMSCVCLGYSEWDLLPESGVLAGVVLVLLAVSFRTGTRYELDLQSANRVGLLIGLLATGWLAYQFINKNSLIYTLPWPASLLPYLGPLLMVLMPAKLFRPKHVGDWWAMQGIALAGVGLASSMAEDEVFGVLLGLYAVAGVTSLTLFFYRRTAGELPPVPHSDPGPAPVVVTSHTCGSGRVIRRALGWLVLAVAIGLPLFFLTPRSQAPKWQYGKSREVGLSTEKLADLNGTGDLGESQAVAFTVRASFPDNRPKNDLRADQRWRAYALSHYEAGRWTSADSVQGQTGWGRPLLLGATSRISEPEDVEYVPPDFGPDQYRLDFTIRDRLGSMVLSDPVIWEVGKSPPVSTTHRQQSLSWYQHSDGTFMPRPVGLTPGGPAKYRQVTRTESSADLDLGPPLVLRPRDYALTDVEKREGVPHPLVDPAGPLVPYRAVRLPKLQFWTRDLLERLAGTNSSVRVALGRAEQLGNFRIAPEDYEPVARALSDHLSRSGEYTYTLKLRRVDPASDPVEEFLFHSKVGHCQRFAAGLVLMLRSVGIPANYVLGFKGCEPEGDGEYTVRQDRAHAWAEVLVARPTPLGFSVQRPPGDDGTLVCHWLSLDPSPDGEATDSGVALTGWLGSARQTGAAFFQNFIVGYNRDRREATVATARDWLIRGGWVVVGLLAIVAGVLIARPTVRRRPKRHAPASSATGWEWYDRMTSALTEGGHEVPPGSTPREFAEAVHTALSGRPETASVADVPRTITGAFYRARYGGLPPDDTEFARMTADIDRLQSSLRTVPRATVRSPESPL